MSDRVLNVFKRQVKVAAYAKTKLVADLIVEFGDCLPHALAAIPVGIVCMRSRDDVRDAILDCQATHRERNVPRLRAVIDARQNMGVDVNHGIWRTHRGLVAWYGQCYQAWAIRMSRFPSLSR